MAIETEIKARIQDPQAVKNKLSVLGAYLYSYTKNDVYWIFPLNPALRLRIRHQEKSFPDGTSEQNTVVTYKIREFHGEMEVNNENEFAVSNSTVFEKILSQLGMAAEIRKEKQGQAWKLSAENTEILAELSMVKNLGHFLELEILNDSCDEQKLTQTCKLLLDQLEALGINRTSIETRSYSDLLRELE